MSKKVNVWDMWARNFSNAKRFFITKGNMKCKARLKAKWYKEFEKDLVKLLAKQKEKV